MTAVPENTGGINIFTGEALMRDIQTYTLSAIHTDMMQQEAASFQAEAKRLVTPDPDSFDAHIKSLLTDETLLAIGRSTANQYLWEARAEEQGTRTRALERLLNHKVLSQYAQKLVSVHVLDPRMGNPITAIKYNPKSGALENDGSPDKVTARIARYTAGSPGILKLYTGRHGAGRAKTSYDVVPVDAGAQPLVSITLL
jgi:hypothetical protein